MYNGSSLQMTQRSYCLRNRRRKQSLERSTYCISNPKNIPHIRSSIVWETVKQPRGKVLLKTLWEKETMVPFSPLPTMFINSFKYGNHHMSYIYFVVCNIFKYGSS